MRLILSLTLWAALAAPAQVLVNGMGGKCLDVEGRGGEGARLIGFACSGADNQKFDAAVSAITAYNGQPVNGQRLCLTNEGSGRAVRLRACTAAPNQLFSGQAGPNGTRIYKNGGLCLDLSNGAAGFYVGNQEVIMYACNGGTNQNWSTGRILPASSVSAADLRYQVRSGELYADALKRLRGSGVISGNGGTVVSGNGGTIVAMGGGNVIAVGGANIVAMGGGN